MRFNEKFGPTYGDIRGYIAEVKKSQFAHEFGGASWNIVDPRKRGDGPALILNLDLGDPKLAPLQVSRLRTVPLCSYINNDIWVQPQTYLIEPDTHSVSLISKFEGAVFEQAAADCLPNPLPQRSLALRAMTQDEYPLNEELYWSNTDEFLGDKPIRILGLPLWLDHNVGWPVCDCGSDLVFVASIGYENYTGPHQLLEERPFFIGEDALYFFLCKTCLRTRVISQNT